MKKINLFVSWLFISCTALIVAAPHALAAASPISLQTQTGTLYGTLELPKTKAVCPVAIIIAGSGPTDRNGNSPLLGGSNDSLRLLAEGLAARGIASVRYDKRGVAASAEAGLDESKLRFENYIEDVMAWGKKLRADKRFSRLVIIGHSEGSLIGMIAAYRIKANAYVSLSGAGEPAGTILETQLRPKLPPELLTEAQSIIKSLNEGKTVDKVSQPLAALFRPSVQPYLISWFRYDPRKEIAKLTIPVLVVQGTTDIQVSVSDARALSANNKRGKLQLIKGMNHVLKIASGNAQQQMHSYTDPALPLAPGLVNGVANLVKPRA